jgi:hypothetical protein
MACGLMGEPMPPENLSTHGAKRNAEHVGGPTGPLPPSGPVNRAVRRRFSTNNDVAIAPATDYLQPY